MRKWHRWIGIIAAIFLISVSATGVILQFQQLFGPDEAEREKLAASISAFTVASPLNNFVPKLEAALRDLTSRIGSTTPLDALELQLKGDHPSFIIHTGGHRFIADANSGQIEHDEVDERESFILRLHTGEIFGDAGVALGLFWGISLLVLTLSGAYLYWQMYRARGKKYGWKRVLWFLLVCFLGLQSVHAEDSDPTCSQTADKNRDAPRVIPEEKAVASPLSGTYVTTFNGSTRGEVKPSVNQRFNFDYSIPRRQVLDLRLEYYTEGSYNADPPGELNHNINEPKIEGQLTFTTPLTDRFALSGALLHHENFRFPDTLLVGNPNSRISAPNSGGPYVRRKYFRRKTA